MKGNSGGYYFFKTGQATKTAGIWLLRVVLSKSEGFIKAEPIEKSFNWESLLYKV